MRKYNIVAVLFMSLLLTACGQKTDSATPASTQIEASVSSIETTQETDNTVSQEPDVENREDEFAVSDDLQVVVLGRYEQDNNLDNGSEQIEWIVLESDGKSALVLSKNILECKPYNDGFAACNWESSSLREWLNNDFFEVAFSDGEKARIIESLVPDFDPELITENEKTDDNTSISDDTSTDESDVVETADDTEAEVVNEMVLTGVYDKVFLLSDFEVFRYLPDDEIIEGDEAYAHPTEYAKTQGVWALTRELFESGHYVENGHGEEIVGAGWWWLRNNTVSTKTKDVDTTGMIRENGHDVGESHDGVRPAMWIVLE